MWTCLRKRKMKKARQDQGGTTHDQGDYNQRYRPELDPKQSSFQAGNIDQYIVEAPGSTSPSQPVELWQGNYRS